MHNHPHNKDAHVQAHIFSALFNLGYIGLRIIIAAAIYALLLSANMPTTASMVVALWFAGGLQFLVLPWRIFLTIWHAIDIQTGRGDGWVPHVHEQDDDGDHTH